ncbi:MAG: porin family protein [Muribaculaceae bacterium]|nr:porin family protein [Muribaculaceae bacterium]
MKALKQIFVASATALSIATAPTAAAIGNRGEKTVGVSAGYNTFNESAVGGVFLQYRVNRLIRLAPDVSYVFKHNNTDGVALNLNVQMPLPIMPTGRVNLYPLAGLNYTSWSYHPEGTKPAIIEGDDVSERVSKFGLNVGAGLDIYATGTLKLFVEGKYVGVRHYSSGVITVGIGYSF